MHWHTGHQKYLLLILLVILVNLCFPHKHIDRHCQIMSWYLPKRYYDLDCYWFYAIFCILINLTSHKSSFKQSMDILLHLFCVFCTHTKYMHDSETFHYNKNKWTFFLDNFFQHNYRFFLVFFFSLCFTVTEVSYIFMKTKLHFRYWSCTWTRYWEAARGQAKRTFQTGHDSFRRAILHIFWLGDYWLE